MIHLLPLLRHWRTASVKVYAAVTGDIFYQLDFDRGGGAVAVDHQRNGVTHLVLADLLLVAGKPMQKVADLQYEVDAPVDDQYVEDWAKDNGYEYPDATVYIPNS